MSPTGGNPSWASRPNELRDASAPNVLRQGSPDAGVAATARRGPIARGFSIPAVVLLAGFLLLSLAPRFLDELTAIQDPCAAVEDLLADPTIEPFDVEPVEWMPLQVAPGFEVTLNRPTTLEIVVAGRVNPEESRIELIDDGFVDGYQQSWVGLTHHASFTAQRFATMEGALGFQAFANRYACQFANEAFRGPRGSIGLQIRYASGQPIGEQVSWVSGTTRVLVSVDHPAAPPDHERIESVVALVGVP
jgi:hypothetical protein